MSESGVEHVRIEEKGRSIRKLLYLSVIFVFSDFYQHWPLPEGCFNCNFDLLVFLLVNFIF